MAFCTSCGTKLDDGTKFCTGCGAAQAVASQTVASETAAVATAPAPVGQTVQAKSGGSALKIILIVLAIIVGLVIVVGGAATYYIAKKAREFRVESKGDSATLNTPWGTVSSNTDAAKVAQDLGVDVYPGARAVKEGTSSVNFGGMSVSTAAFDSSDSIDKVEEFYKARFPKSNISVGDEGGRTMVVTSDKGMITVVLKELDGKTRIEISRTGSGKKDNEGGSE